MARRCLVVQHVAPEEPYRIGEALRTAGLTLDVRRVFAGDDVPGTGDDWAAVVVMGGPMSAYADAGFPTRRREITLLADAVRRQVPVLCVCLGAQLLAEAAGGRARPGHGPEIGWAPVTLTGGAASDALLADLPASFPVLHWHGDTMDLPPDAVPLAATDAYPIQAFRVGAQAWGLQFHLEVDRRAVAAFLAAFGSEAEAAPGGSAAVVAGTGPALAALEPIGGQVLERFARLAAHQSISQ